MKCVVSTSTTRDAGAIGCGPGKPRERSCSMSCTHDVKPNRSLARASISGEQELSPDIVLMDLEMPQMSGLTATDLLRKENPGVKVLILSMHSHSEYVLRILQSGARGYILKEAPT